MIRAPRGTRARTPQGLFARAWRSDFAQTKGVVQASEPVAAEIDRHVRVADRPETRIDLFSHRGLDGPGDLVAPKLEPRDRLVVAHTAYAEAQIVQHGFGALDHPEFLVRDFREVWNTGREACGCRFIPRR